MIRFRSKEEYRSNHREVDLIEGNEKMDWRRFVCAVLSVVLVCGGLRADVARAASEDDYYELMKIFVDTFEQIDRNYVTQVDRRELMEAAMRGMIHKLDPYSSYIDNKEIRSFNEHVEQEFGGIGIQVTVDRSRQLMVMTPLPGTPAYRAGVRTGDRILEIDDKPTSEFLEGSEMESAVGLMRGKPDTVVKIKIQHLGSETPETIEIKRAVIKTPTVYGDHQDSTGQWSYWIDESEKIGYIRLTSFGRNSAEEVNDVLKKLQKDGMRGLILDMRFNPGGLLTAATAIADYFISTGVIVSTKGRNTEEHVVKAKKAGTFSGFPMVVLVNRYSASASEIVSACLQDHKRAIVIGERTWGKGSVQNVIELENGKSALKLTTASYHRPSGKNIHRFPKATDADEWGVMPDEGFNLRMSEQELKDLFESRVDREVIRPNGEVSKSTFVDKQMIASVDVIKKMLTEGKVVVEQPVEGKPAADEKNEDPKPEAEKKTDGASLIIAPHRRSYVDAILEFWRVQPAWKILAL